MLDYEKTAFEKISNGYGGSVTVGNLSSTEAGSWFAVHTKARHEKKTNRALTEKDVETFLPLREVINQWKDRKKKVLLPLYPGYMFVRIDPRDRFDVLNTAGVVRILGNNGVPTPVPAEEIEATRILLETGFKYDLFPYDVTGREVEVAKGPLQGARGRILWTKGAYSLVLSVHLIRRSVSVEVDLNDVDFI